MSDNFEYDVALTFAGQDREHAERLANLLTDVGVRVFYDSFETSSLWGEDLYTYLADVSFEWVQPYLMWLG